MAAELCAGEAFDPVNLASDSVAATIDARRRSVSVQAVGCGIRAYTPTLWQARLRQNSNERTRPERDSLRSRSNEGRPGSRKHRRWTRSQEVVRSYRRIFALADDFTDADIEALVKSQQLIEHRPSVFYRLLEHEGPARALEVWEAAERGRRPRSRPRRAKTEAQVKLEAARCARTAFGHNWSYLQSQAAPKEFLLQLEELTTRAFALGDWTDVAMPDDLTPQTQPDWSLHWDGCSFETSFGGPPACEIAISGLDPAQRKFVHQFSRLLGLHSESRSEPRCRDHGKVLLLRPPQRYAASGQAWKASFSLSSLLSSAVSAAPA